MKTKIARCPICNKRPSQKKISFAMSYYIATIIFCKNKKCDNNINGVGLNRDKAIEDWNQMVR